MLRAQAINDLSILWPDEIFEVKRIVRNVWSLRCLNSSFRKCSMVAKWASWVYDHFPFALQTDSSCSSLRTGSLCPVPPQVMESELAALTAALANALAPGLLGLRLRGRCLVQFTESMLPAWGPLQSLEVRGRLAHWLAGWLQWACPYLRTGKKCPRAACRGEPCRQALLASTACILRAMPRCPPHPAPGAAPEHPCRRRAGGADGAHAAHPAEHQRLPGAAGRLAGPGLAVRERCAALRCGGGGGAGRWRGG